MTHKKNIMDERDFLSSCLAMNGHRAQLMKPAPITPMKNAKPRTMASTMICDFGAEE